MNLKITFVVTLLFVFGMVSPTLARNGYHIHLKMPGVKDSTVYLTHYYGQPLPHIYKSDSAKFNKNGIAEFNSDDSSFTGGIYMMLLADHKTYFEFLLNNGDEMTITAPLKDIPNGIKYKNAPENDQFQKYLEFLNGYSEGQAALEKEYKSAKTAADSEAVRKKMVGTSHDLINYRRDIKKEYPTSLLAKIFNALEIPEIPKGPHYLADGVTRDSTYVFMYYKSHFWDGFDFQDDRLIHTPLYDNKLKEYITKMVLPWPDSLEHECDFLLNKTRGTNDLFKYTLWYLTNYMQDSKIMGMDEVFVYLVENYYMKGDATWISNNELMKYEDRAMKIAPNVIGNLAPDLKLPNVVTKKEEALQGFKAKYTLLIFYSPSCGHCQHEIPLIDSIYNASLKARGVKVFTVATEGEERAITDFITKYKMDDWTNTWDHDRKGDWKAKYDVYSTPTIYFLDEKKIIKGKRLDHSNIADLMEMLDKKEKYKEKTTKSKS